MCSTCFVFGRHNRGANGLSFFLALTQHSDLKRFSRATEEKQRSPVASISPSLRLPPSIGVASVVEECRLSSVVAKIAIGVLCSVPAAGVCHQGEPKRKNNSTHTAL